MSETTAGNQRPATDAATKTTTDAPAPAPVESAAIGIIEVPDEAPAIIAHEDETAREVAAQHFARLLYAPQSTWSRYVFHENDPYPFGSSRPGQGRG
jgi:hypothetical protein